MEEKIKLIDEICAKHPAYGVEKGWSEYVGGMADTGRWHFRKMLDVDIDELDDFLDKIKSEETKPRQVFDGEESEKDAVERFYKEMEEYFWIGQAVKIALEDIKQ